MAGPPENEGRQGRQSGGAYRPLSIRRKIEEDKEGRQSRQYGATIPSMSGLRLKNGRPCDITDAGIRLIEKRGGCSLTGTQKRVL